MNETPAEMPMPQARVRRGFFLVALALITFAFFGLIKDFLGVVFWAAILAIVFSGVHQWMRKKFPGRVNRPALFTVLLVLAGVVIPLIMISAVLAEEAMSVYERIESGDWHPKAVVTKVSDRIPLIGKSIEKFGISIENQSEMLAKFGTTLAGKLGDMALKSTQSLARMIAEFTVMLYVLFFFIRDGRSIVAGIKRVVPIGDSIEDYLFTRFARVSRATIQGALLVAIIQGTLGGIMFAMLGIPGATLWGVVMVILSLLPAVGSGLVWGPAAILMLINGDYLRAGIMLAVGIGIISMIDNVLRPRLVGDATSMPDYVILISTLGGIATFGLSGFIIGPVIAALFMTCWEITGKMFGGTAE